MRNLYFENFENSGEQSLIEDLVIESIKIYGVDCWYIPKTVISQDRLLNEASNTVFSNAAMIEMYVKNVDGFEGEGDFLSKFGLEIRDSMTLTVANRVFDDEMAYSPNERPRPFEGDLIFFPLNKKIYEIMHVEHESVFYQLGSLQTYDLRCELYEYSGQTINTKQDFIDETFREYKNWSTYNNEDTTFSLYVNDTEDGFNVTIPEALQRFDAPAYAANVFENTSYKFNISNENNLGRTILPRTDGADYEEYSIQGTPGEPNSYLVINTHGHEDGIIEIDISDISKSLRLTVMQSLDSVEGIDEFDNTADNFVIQQEADNILDFSEQNPFGEDEY